MECLFCSFLVIYDVFEKTHRYKQLLFAFLFAAFILAILFFVMREFYMKTSRAVKRNEGVARSPIFSLVGTSLDGLATIRAFKMEKRLIALFDRQQDIHSSAWFTFLSIGRWLGMSSDLLVNFFLTCVVVIPLISSRGM